MDKELTINVGYVAELAQLRLTPEEESRLDGELKQMVAYFRNLQKVDVAGVEPMIYGGAQGTARPALFRVDAQKPSLDREAVLQQAPERLGDEFKVPRIVE